MGGGSPAPIDEGCEGWQETVHGEHPADMASFSSCSSMTDIEHLQSIPGDVEVQGLSEVVPTLPKEPFAGSHSFCFADEQKGRPTDVPATNSMVEATMFLDDNAYGTVTESAAACEDAGGTSVGCSSAVFVAHEAERSDQKPQNFPDSSGRINDDKLVGTDGSAGRKRMPNVGAAGLTLRTLSSAIRSQSVKGSLAKLKRKRSEVEGKVFKRLAKLGEHGGGRGGDDSTGRSLEVAEGIGGVSRTTTDTRLNGGSSPMFRRILRITMLLLVFIFLAQISLMGLCSPGLRLVGVGPTCHVTGPNVPPAENSDTGLASGKEIAGVRSEFVGVKNDIARVRSEVANVTNEIAGVRSEVAGFTNEIAELRVEVYGQLRAVLKEIGWVRGTVGGLLAEDKVRQKPGRENGRGQGQGQGEADFVGQDYGPEVFGQLRSVLEEMGWVRGMLTDLLAEKVGPVAGAGVEQTRWDRASVRQKRAEEVGGRSEAPLTIAGGASISAGEDLLAPAVDPTGKGNVRVVKLVFAAKDMICSAAKLVVRVVKLVFGTLKDVICGAAMLAVIVFKLALATCLLRTLGV